MVNLKKTISDKKSTSADSNRCIRGYNRLLLLFPAMFFMLILSYFGMEAETLTERYTVIGTAVNDSGVYITLSDNVEYAGDDSTLDGLTAGDEVLLTTVRYRGGSEKTLINNEKVYSSEDSRKDENFRVILNYVWTFLNIILALISVMVIFDLLPVVLGA